MSSESSGAFQAVRETEEPSHCFRSAINGPVSEKKQ